MSAKVTLPDFRINPAALGRRLASTILQAKERGLTPEEFTDTVTAVFESCVSEEYSPAPGSAVDTEILAAEQAEIEKSVRRSAIARMAAERRRRLREQALSTIEIVAPSSPVVTTTTTEETAEATSATSSSKRRRRNRRRKNRQNHC